MIKPELIAPYTEQGSPSVISVPFSERLKGLAGWQLLTLTILYGGVRCGWRRKYPCRKITMHRAACQGWSQFCYLGYSVTSWYLARIVVAKLAQAHMLLLTIPSLILVNGVGSVFSFFVF